MQTDQALFWWKVVAGVASVGCLVALFATSLVRSPNPAYSVVVAVAVLVLDAAIAWGVWRRSRR